MKNKILFIIPLLFLTTICLAQIKIGTSTEAPNAGAMLEVESSNRGFLLTRIFLTSNTMQLNNTIPPNGMLIYNTNTSSSTGLMGSGLYVWNGQWNLVVENGILEPIGSYKLSVANSMAGYLLCNGAPVSRTTYAKLFAVIGTAFGSGDGASTFNLPDLRGRVHGGIGTGTGLTARSLGAIVGAESIILSVSQMPSHRHRTTVAASGNDGSFGNTGSSTYSEAISGTANRTQPVAWTDYAGSNAPSAHNVMQPTLFGGNTFIKY